MFIMIMDRTAKFFPGSKGSVRRRVKIPVITLQTIF